MGCDIHLFVEYFNQGQIVPWSTGELRVGRDYQLFGALAGVRGSQTPLFPARGLPSDLSPEVFEQYYLFIVEPAQALATRGFNWVSPDEAEELIRAGAAHRHPPGYVKYGMTSPRGYISNPAWHTPSWLTQHEVQKAIDHASVQPREDFLVVMDVLTAIASRVPDARARLVFWFDN